MAETFLQLAALGFDAAAPITKYSAVKLATADAVTPIAAEGDLWIGISQYGVSAGEITRGKGASVMVAGLSLVKVGVGGVTVGTLVAIDAAGLVVAANAGGRPLGIAYATGVAGDYIPVWLTPGLLAV